MRGTLGFTGAIGFGQHRDVPYGEPDGLCHALAIACAYGVEHLDHEFLGLLEITGVLFSGPVPIVFRILITKGVTVVDLRFLGEAVVVDSGHGVHVIHRC